MNRVATPMPKDSTKKLPPMGAKALPRFWPIVMVETATPALEASSVRTVWACRQGVPISPPHAVPGDELAGVGGVQHIVDGEEHAVPARRNTQNGLAMAKAWPNKNRA